MRPSVDFPTPRSPIRATTLNNAFDPSMGPEQPAPYLKFRFSVEKAGDGRKENFHLLSAINLHFFNYELKWS